jgi:hypothetical protein
MWICIVLPLQELTLAATPATHRDVFLLQYLNLTSQLDANITTETSAGEGMVRGTVWFSVWWK